MIPTIDLFSGAGGLSYGLKEAGLEIKAAVEIDKIASKTYKKNIGDIILTKDIKDVSGLELLEFAGIKKGEMFVMAGCPPCQGFSSVGPRNENDVRNQLVFQFTRLINETEPWFIIMENVPGMAKGIGKKIFAEVKKELKKEYFIQSDILDSANYGVPQHRKRLVLHGIKKDVFKKFLPDDFDQLLPEPTHGDPNNTDSGLKKWNTVSIIKDLPKLKAGEGIKEIPNHRTMGLSSKNIERIKNTPPNGGSRTSWPESLVLNCHKGKVGYNDVYGRMNFDDLAPTITAGCLSYSKGRFGHPEQDRAISAREASRLQTFSDDFEFEGSLSDIGKQIGNAVPPKLAKASGKHIKNLIETFNIY